MLSIIICTYNRDKFIYSSLQKVAENGCAYSDYEIVLVNNNSTDDTEKLCNKFQTEYPQVTFRYFVETSQGLSFARNRGIAESKGEWLVFIDDDAMPQPGYLSNLKANIAQNSDAGAFGGQIIPEFESGVAPDWLCRWTYSWVSAIDMGNSVKLFEGGKFPIGANMGISRAAIEKCGTFNTELGRNKKNLMGGEEKDIFLRLKTAGIPIYYFPNVSVNHIIPPHRTTPEFIAKLGAGIGASERLRCRNNGTKALLKRYLLEMFKWGATITLWVFYMLTLRPACGNMLVKFRYNVSAGLLAS
ncbi:MAG: glycosyltransferase family 2 protein [Salinivirgaceae bacterium]|nr:glycosyltransferase family 2 protein [Salinivirgaceae bacterium]